MRKVINTIFTLLFLTLSVSTAVLIYLHFFKEADENLSGEWIAELDLTQQAAVTALDWLQDIEAVDLSLQDMEGYMQGLTVQVNLTLEQTAPSMGKFYCNILPESYDACNQAAYEAFAMAFRDILAERLRMAGYMDCMDEEAIEAFVNEAFGMSTVSYLMSYGPVLLPPLEELQAGYDGSGTYEAVEGMLIRQFDDDKPVAVKTECYIQTEFYLILSEETDAESVNSLSGHSLMVYALKQPLYP